MDDLIAFLNARLDEDEAAAKEAATRPGGPSWGGPVGGTRLTAVSAHIARHDPARALREVAANRAILDRHSPHQPAFGDLACDWCSEDVDDRPQIAKERWPCPDIRSLAAVYSDHPDYRAEWKP